MRNRTAGHLFISFNAQRHIPGCAAHGPAALCGPSHSIPAQVLRTPRALQEQGCGYCVRAPAEPETIRQLLTAERIAFRRLYRRGADGAWQEAEP